MRGDDHRHAGKTRALSLMLALPVNSGTRRCDLCDVYAVWSKRPLRLLHELPKAQQLLIALGNVLFRCSC